MNYVLITASVGIALSLMLMASKNAKPVSLNNGDILLTYANSIKVLGVVLSIIAVGGSILLVFNVPIITKSDKQAVFWLFLAAVFVSVYFYIEFFTVKITLKNNGIAGTSGWRGARSYDWTEIEEITYSPLSMWFTIRASSKKPLRVHGMITGIDEFQKHYMANLNKQVWASAYENAKKDNRVNK